MTQYPVDMAEYYRMAIMAKTGQDIKKQYVLKPVSYEQTYLKGVNEQLLKEYEKHKEIANQEQRETAIQELKEEVARRMAGTLFDGDTSQVENVVLPEKHPKQQKKRNPKPSTDEQGKLF